MHTYAKVTKDIQVAARAIAQGRAVAFPTGTSYGLAVNALDGHALQRLRNLKGRGREKTFTVCLREDLWDTFLDLADEEQALLAKHQNQPLTLLVKPAPELEHLAQDGRVGLRVVDHPIMQAFVDSLEVPITATSANISGQPACYSAQCIVDAFPGLLDPSDTRHGDIERAGSTTYDLSLGSILDGGMLPEKMPTTIARIVGSDVEIVRQGAVDLTSA